LAGTQPGFSTISLRGGGLIAPVIHDADQKSLAELMSALRDLVQRARIGGLRSSELTDPTITVTSLGERGAETVIGIIYPPQVALVGFDRIVERPWAVGRRACRTAGGDAQPRRRSPCKRRPPWRPAARRDRSPPAGAWSAL
jgi:pyruvate/2-oxoglutarate dehydrogenase complex dihydrolipoamide acyltransferase (E2) component